MTAMRHVRASRRRTGAVRWNLYRDAADPQRFVESFVVPSWGGHLRQHPERQTIIDQQLDQEVRALVATDPQIAHLLPAR